jgi:hypothetical protein
VEAIKFVSVYVMVLTSTEAMRFHGPTLDAARSMWKPLMLVEFLTHARLIVLDVAATAVRLLGVASGGVGLPLLAFEVFWAIVDSAAVITASIIIVAMQKFRQIWFGTDRIFMM